MCKKPYVLGLIPAVLQQWTLWAMMQVNILYETPKIQYEPQNEHNVGPLSLKYLHSELKWASRFSWVKVWNGSDLIKIWNIQICVHRINMLLWFDGWILDCIWTVMVPTSVIMSLKIKKNNLKTLFPLKTLQGSNDHPLQTWQIKCCWEPAVSLLSNTKP